MYSPELTWQEYVGARRGEVLYKTVTRDADSCGLNWVMCAQPFLDEEAYWQVKIGIWEDVESSIGIALSDPMEYQIRCLFVGFEFGELTLAETVLQSILQVLHHENLSG